MVRGLLMPLGRVILAASEARVSGEASSNSGTTNTANTTNNAICLIEHQLQSAKPHSLLWPKPNRGMREAWIIIIIALLGGLLSI
jgi:hypothetical protein